MRSAILGADAREDRMPAAPTPDRTAVAATLRRAGSVFAEDEADVLIAAATTTDELDALVRRRCAGEPVEHVVGWAELCGRRVLVGPGVFVPRRRTEHLVAEALRRTGDGVRVVVDLCCGSGAVALVLAEELGRRGVRPQMWAVDVDPAAAACARRNLAGTGAQVRVGDLLDPLPDALRGTVDLIVANAPYVPTAEIGLLPPEARLHEPLAALDGGPDGLDVHRRVADVAGQWLAPGGVLIVEVGQRQAATAEGLLRAAGLDVDVTTSDELDATVVLGRAAAP